MKKMLLTCVLLLCPIMSWADEATFNKIVDPAFDMYVNPETLDLARNTPEASLMLDVALQLAEGERVLLRSHRAVSSEELLKLAAKIAAVKEDKETQQRLKLAAEKLGKENLVAEFDSIAALAGNSRGLPKPKFSTDDKEIGLVLDGAMEAAENAVLLENRAMLAQIEMDLLSIELPEKVAAEAAKFLAEANEQIPADAISKLAGASRQFPGGGGSSVKPCDVIVDSQTGLPPYISSRLRAKFMVVPNGGRAVVQLYPSSPLRSGGIEVGDIITHLDGVPVYTDWELENHYRWTNVYGIDWRTGNTFTRKIYIP